MHIGFFTGSAREVGSGQSMIFALARSLTTMGHQVTVLETNRYWLSHDIANGIVFHGEPILPQVLARPIVGLGIARMKLESMFSHEREGYALPTAYDLAIQSTLQAGIKKLKLDVLYAFHGMNVFNVLYSDTPPNLVLVINLVGFGIDPSRGGSDNTFPYMPLVFEKPLWDLHIAATEFEYSQYQSVYRQLHLSEDKLMLLPHCYDVDAFYPMDDTSRRLLKAKYGVGHAGIVMVYPVNVYRRKNIELAIKILAAMGDDASCYLIVSGAIIDRVYFAELIEQATRQRVRDRLVFLDGTTQYDDMVKIYNIADVTIFPSHQETFGIGIVESLGCGTPVVGPTWLTPCRDILEGALGGRLAEKSSHDFASKVRQVMLDKSLERTQIANEAARRYGNNAVGRRFLACVETSYQLKQETRSNLASIDWKGLYKDEVKI